MPVDTFVETIERYNEQCDQNYDDDFLQSPVSTLSPLTGKKFYALRFAPGAYGSFGRHQDQPQAAGHHR